MSQDFFTVSSVDISCGKSTFTPNTYVSTTCHLLPLPLCTQAQEEHAPSAVIACLVVFLFQTQGSERLQRGHY